jgi:hypothetical protein
MNEETILALFIALESVHFYSAFMPSVFTIEHFAGNQQDVASLRRGEVIATIFSLSVGILMSKIIKSKLPFMLTLITSTVMILLYENSIRNHIK